MKNCRSMRKIRKTELENNKEKEGKGGKKTVTRKI